MSISSNLSPLVNASAAGAVSIYRFVALDATSGTDSLVVKAAGASDAPIGISQQAATEAGQTIGFLVGNGGGINLLEVNGASTNIAAGDYLEPTTGGIGVKTDGGTVYALALESATTDGRIIKVLNLTAGAPGLTVARSAIVQQDLVPYTVPLESLKTWDNRAVNLPATAAADDLAIVTGTFLTGNNVVQTGDSKAASTTRKAAFTFPVPAEYVAGQTITLRVNAGMVTTVSDTSATLDAQVVDTATPGTDICATNATSINSLTAANVDFTITPTNVAPGDLLNVVLTIAIVDGATGTAVIGQINSIALLLDIKG